MLGIGLLQTAVVCVIVMSSGFLQDDYLYFGIARLRGFTLQGMTTSVFGSIIPGFMLVNTILSTQHPIARYQAELIVIVLYAAIVLIFYRLLELLFGARPAVVCLTTIATCSGLLGVSLAWWTPSINSLPAVAADLLAFDGLIRHAMTGKRRHLVVSVVSFAVATVFYDPSMTLVVMFVLFTILYLAEPGGWRPAVRAMAAALGLGRLRGADRGGTGMASISFHRVRIAAQSRVGSDYPLYGYRVGPRLRSVLDWRQLLDTQYG